MGTPKSLLWCRRQNSACQRRPLYELQACLPLEAGQTCEQRTTGNLSPFRAFVSRELLAAKHDSRVLYTRYSCFDPFGHALFVTRMSGEYSDDDLRTS